MKALHLSVRNSGVVIEGLIVIHCALHIGSAVEEIPLANITEALAGWRCVYLYAKDCLRSCVLSFGNVSLISPSPVLTVSSLCSRQKLLIAAAPLSTVKVVPFESEV